MRPPVAYVLSFITDRFDIAREDPNPINPIAGQSVLRWLRAELVNAQCRASEPETEDWGWYIDVECGGAAYLVGASADAHEATPRVEWTIQVHRHRSLLDRLSAGTRLPPTILSVRSSSACSAPIPGSCSWKRRTNGDVPTPPAQAACAPTGRRQ